MIHGFWVVFLPWPLEIPPLRAALIISGWYEHDIINASNHPELCLDPKNFPTQFPHRLPRWSIFTFPSQGSRQWTLSHNLPWCHSQTINALEFVSMHLKYPNPAWWNIGNDIILAKPKKLELLDPQVHAQPSWSLPSTCELIASETVATNPPNCRASAQRSAGF